MNSNCTQINITPFRLFDENASKNFKRRMAVKIQTALNTISFENDTIGGLEDAAIAQRILASQIHTIRHWSFITFP